MWFNGWKDAEEHVTRKKRWEKWAEKGLKRRKRVKREKGKDIRAKGKHDKAKHNVKYLHKKLQLILMKKKKSSGYYFSPKRPIILRTCVPWLRRCSCPLGSDWPGWWGELQGGAASWEGLHALQKHSLSLTYHIYMFQNIPQLKLPVLTKKAAYCAAQVLICKGLW